ncbi:MULTISPECIES: DUF6153 family protein [Prauserella salsuginis group]|uniref:DUF6153 family protein n=1 Tax=Prauserella salsuginis TaxID=387889 RepID=A0ABW6GBE7_9PSEU|nr:MULTISPECIES: DUF6153 family protein [Prauserella salsuginis group]MCR3722895.1 hypothetical protein [Prauserella flava]MCR3737430.1 hypothetical protein [Prauserella salsuginis]
MLLTLCVLFGVVGMHALVTPPASPAAAGAASTTAGHEIAGHEVAGHRANEPRAAVTQEVQPQTEHAPPADHESQHDLLLHLCLAVLAAAGLIVPAARSVLGRVRPAAPARRSPSPFGRMPVQRPPPVSRRLAQLCVLRT